VRLLIVDDHQDTADTLQMIMEAYGHEVNVAYGGPQALDLARLFHPEAVICDLGMPHMDGYMLCGALRELPELEETVFIACTGYGDAAPQERALRAGYDHVAVKPVHPTVLHRMLTGAEPAFRRPASPDPEPPLETIIG
jgi:CheY-like chemotaxis protein